MPTGSKGSGTQAGGDAHACALAHKRAHRQHASVQVMSTRVEEVMHRTPRTCTSSAKAIDAMQARRA